MYRFAAEWRRKAGAVLYLTRRWVVRSRYSLYFSGHSLSLLDIRRALAGGWVGRAPQVPSTQAHLTIAAPAKGEGETLVGPCRREWRGSWHPLPAKEVSAA